MKRLLILKRGYTILEKNEQENNLILGVLQMVQQPIFMGIAKQEEEVAVVFLQTEEKKQIIVATSEMVEEAIVELAKISGSISECSGLIGNKKVVQRLAEEIAVLENKNECCNGTRCVRITTS